MGNSVDFGGRPFHFIGIGGIGMSALAQIMAERQLPVSGSDIRLNHITQRLEDLGAQIFERQDGTNLQFFDSNGHFRDREEVGKSDRANPSLNNGNNRNGDQNAPADTPPAYSGTPQALPQVVCSTAINPNNPEYQAALKLGCPIFHRSDILAALIQDYQSIAVSGTHGKTTTSGLLSYTLYRVGLDPTVVIGGEVNALGGNARLGQGPYLVAEADESDGSLVKFAPKIGVITNIELDHPDHYTDLGQVIATFKHFTTHCQVVVACIDCPTISSQFQPTLSYSLDPDLHADYTVKNVQYQGDGSRAQVWEKGECLGELRLRLLGYHNLSNALAVIAVGRYLGVPFPALAEAMAEFEGARRRFEYRGCANGIALVDDYAHHPSEIQVTLAAARLQVQTQSSPFPIEPKRVVAVFQPHRYSRTEALLDQFCQSFGDADMVVVCEVYGAGETKRGNADGQQVAAVMGQHHPVVHYGGSLEQVAAWLGRSLIPGDLVLFLGAGNLNQIIPKVLDHLEQLQAPAYPL
jgi:UDP-N-acetylmuramate--alanine ligase